jgi:hypothetical protein
MVVEGVFKLFLDPITQKIFNIINIFNHGLVSMKPQSYPMLDLTCLYIENILMPSLSLIG